MPTPFTFSAPRDARSPVVERLEWATDVQASRDGTEQRAQLRPMPRHTVSFDVLLHTEAARACMAALRQETRFLVPQWQHVFEQPTTAPDAGVSALQGSCLALDHFGYAVEVPPPFAWPADTDVAAPAAVARLAADQRSIRHITGSGGVCACFVSAGAVRRRPFPPTTALSPPAFRCSMCLPNGARHHRASRCRRNNLTRAHLTPLRARFSSALSRSR